jgi:hypothetical protein
MGWGFDDWEREQRFLNLGYREHRVPGLLFHLNHPKTGTSRNTVKDHVRALTDHNHLTRHGAGRGAWYAPG